MIFSLQKRFLIFLLLPVVLILLISGVASFFYARSYLLDEWTAMSKLRLGWTAHQIQMRLNSKRELIKLIVKAEAAPDSKFVQAFLTQQLSEMPGVRFVELQSLTGNAPTSQNLPDTTNGTHRQALAEFVRPVMDGMPMMNGMRGRGTDKGGRPGEPMDMREMMNRMHGRGTDKGGRPGEWMDMRRMMTMMQGRELSFDESRNFLSMTETFGGTKEAPAKKIMVTISFQSFMKGILEAGKWEHSYACLVKSDGTYLAHTDPSMENLHKLGETGDPLEKKALEEMKTKEFGSVLGEGHPPDRVLEFYKVPTTDWYLLLVSPGSEILAPIVRFRFTYLFAGVISLICVGVLIQWSTRPIAQSITEISKAAEEVENGNFSLEIPEDRSDEIGQLKRRFNQMIKGLKQRDLIERTFGRYVDKKIAQELMNTPEALNLGGVQHVVTILIADLRDFTPMAERLQPEHVIKLLNRYFARMIPVIEEFEGIIVDFYGDSILVFFNGTESDVRVSVTKAVTCAFEMQREAAALSVENERDGLPGLSMGIGIHTGEVIVGNIGTETRAKYGIVGSAVNETDRIQAVAQGGSIIVSENTYEFLPDTVEVGQKCQADLKGLNRTRDLYELKEKPPIDSPSPS